VQRSCSGQGLEDTKQLKIRSDKVCDQNIASIILVAKSSKQ
ncbi:unnamed protein product, partial [Acidithrix sp. C25]